MRRARAGLEVLFWAWLVGSLSALAASAYSQWMWEKIRSGDSITGLLHAYSWTGQASLVCGVATWIAIAVALVVVVRAPEAEKLRIRNLGTFAIVSMSSAIALRFIQSAEFKAGSVANTMRLMVIFALFGMLQRVCLLLLLRRVAAAQGKPLPAWITIGVGAHIAWLLLGGLVPILQTPALAWPRLGIYALLELPMLAALWHTAHVRTLPRAIADVPDGLGADALVGPAWRRTADGLAAYRLAVVAKLVVILLGAVLVAARAAAFGSGLGLVWMLVDLVLTLVLVAGLCGYAAVPDETEARVTAWMATGSALVLLCLQAYQVWLLVQMLDDRPGHLEAQLVTQQQLGLVLMVTLLVSFAGLLLLLASLRALATWLVLPGAAQLAGWASLAVGATALAGVGMVLSATDGPRSTWPLILLALPLVAFVTYLRLLHALLRELRARLAAGATSAPR